MITLETNNPVAIESPDHIFPWGTMRDNSTNEGFINEILAYNKTKGKETAQGAEKVFARNLIDEFGDVEVKEAFRIIDDRTPELEKLFYKKK